MAWSGNQFVNDMISSYFTLFCFQGNEAFHVFPMLLLHNHQASLHLPQLKVLKHVIYSSNRHSLAL
jgi:hypothetical protein